MRSDPKPDWIGAAIGCSLFLVPLALHILGIAFE